MSDAWSDTEPYAALLERWQNTATKHLLDNAGAEAENAMRILRAINSSSAPLTPARKAMLVLVAAHEGLKAELDAEQAIVADVLQAIYLEWRNGATFENMPLAIAARIELQRQDRRRPAQHNDDHPDSLRARLAYAQRATAEALAILARIAELLPPGEYDMDAIDEAGALARTAVSDKS